MQGFAILGPKNFELTYNKIIKKNNNNNTNNNNNNNKNVIIH